MPTISTFFGFTIQMYWRDHPPPHIHVFYAGAEALVSIETGRVIAGQLPRGALRVIRAWVKSQRSALHANWKRATLLQPLVQVPGADVA